MSLNEPFAQRLDGLVKEAPEELARLQRQRDELDEQIEFLRKLCGAGRGKRDSKPAPAPELVREMLETSRKENPSHSDTTLEAEVKRRLKEGGFRVIGIHRSIRSILAEPNASTAEH